MTEEEQKLFDSIIKSVYGNLDVEKIKARELIKEYCLKNDLKVREMEELLDQKGCNFFFEVIEKFRKQTGLLVVHATKHELGKNINNNQQEEEYAQILKEEVLEKREIVKKH